MTRTALSCFSGIGGFDKAASELGITPGMFVEIDPFCQLVLAKHWPRVRGGLRANRLKSLGNAIVPQVALIILKAILAADDEQNETR